MINVDGTENTFSSAGIAQRTRIPARPEAEILKKNRRAIRNLEREIESINCTIERLQEKRAFFRGRVAQEINPPGGRQGRWLSLNSALMLLAGAFDAQLRGFNPLLSGAIVSLILSLWVVYIHEQMSREKSARDTDAVLYAQIREEFARMEILYHRLAALRREMGIEAHLN